MVTAPKQPMVYSYRDYCGWPDDERWELIDGMAYNMVPAPSTQHQRVSGRIFQALRGQLAGAGSACELFYSPFDVILDETNVVQPDLLLICDPTKIVDEGCRGTPDLVIEILSPSTALRDQREKRELYQRFGVADYLLVDPIHKVVQHLSLQGDQYGPARVLGLDDVLEVTRHGLSLSIGELFA